MRKYLILSLVALSVTACVSDSKKELFSSTASEVQLRGFQSRAFDTTDREKTLRIVIATLQDLGFVISKADSLVGVVSASKFANQHSAQITVTVQQRGQKQTVVRANVQQHLKAVETPELYQDFFNSLQKAMFLTAQAVD
jgi:hypothetical protein